MEANMSDLVTLKDVTLMWPCLTEKNKMSGKYQVDLCNLTPEHIKELKTLGLNTRTKAEQPEKGSFITCKSARPIKALTPDGDTIPSKVGNGSIASLRLGSYPWTNPAGKNGISASIVKLVVTNLVEYNPGTGAEEEDADFV
jgi:hypothetical protein